MTRIFRKDSGDRSTLLGERIAVLGFGNQGRSQALNLRDSGLDVIVGNRDDEYAATARRDGFDVRSIVDAAALADVVLVLLPDEIFACELGRSVVDRLRPGSLVAFASGYNLAYSKFTFAAQVDVALLAPRMLGGGVRDRYLDGTGFYAFVSVEQDGTGRAWSRLLALADAIGSLDKGCLEVSAKMEAELDLFNEQAFGPAFGRVLTSAIKTLIDAGYPKEAVLVELYLSGEFGYIFQEVARTGLFENLSHHSPASQYGALSRGIKFLRFNLRRPMQGILRHIQNGGFAREWAREQKLGNIRRRLLRWMAFKQPLRALERETLDRLLPPERSDREVGEAEHSLKKGNEDRDLGKENAEFASSKPD